jgi:hypothetical protein
MVGATFHFAGNNLTEWSVRNFLERGERKSKYALLGEALLHPHQIQRMRLSKPEAPHSQLAAIPYGSAVYHAGYSFDLRWDTLSLAAAQRRMSRAVCRSQMQSGEHASGVYLAHLGNYEHLEVRPKKAAARPSLAA